MNKATRISALISQETKELLERHVRATGVKKGHLIEQALRHHLQALQELPADVIVHPRLGRYNRADEPAHRAARDQLLAPLWKQTQAARALRGRRAGSVAEPGAGEPELPATEQPGQPGEQPAA